MQFAQNEKQKKGLTFIRNAKNRLLSLVTYMEKKICKIDAKPDYTASCVLRIDMISLFLIYAQD